MIRRVIFIFFGLVNFSQIFAQIEQDTSNIKQNQNPDVIIQTDSTNVLLDSAFIIRQEFIRDSLLAREQFVKDSLYRRKLILDSVSFFKENLPRLIEAAIKSNREEIIIFAKPVNVIGDSTLSDFSYTLLAQTIDKPYAPWRARVKLSGNTFKIKTDTVHKKILSVRSPEINYSFDYGFDNKIVRMNGRKTIVKKQKKNYYKYPIDSVFFDTRGRVKKIKKYIHYFEATEKYKKGAFVGADLDQVKEFDYFSDGVLSNYRHIKYYDRWSGREPSEIGHIVNYSLSRQGKKFTVVKKNTPASVFSDGTFIYKFDDNFDMKYMEFTNANKSLTRNCIIELNDDRNVSRYLYRKDGIINKTLLIKYDNSPNAKYKVETTLCYFEDDGISYYQKNTTTGKSRTRDKLTMKWNPWK